MRRSKKNGRELPLTAHDIAEVEAFREWLKKQPPQVLSAAQRLEKARMAWWSK